MKQLLYLLLLSLPLLALECRREEPKPKDPLSLLPAATQQGKNTFGCLVNGEAFVPIYSTDADAVYQQGSLEIGGNQNSQARNIIIWVIDPHLTIGNYPLDGSVYHIARFYDQKTKCEYLTRSEEGLQGTLTITRIDRERYILSGLFSFTAYSEDCQDTVRVTDGRFDLQYIP